MTALTLDAVLAMTAEDAPELADEVARLLRFREAHRIHEVQQAEVDAEARLVASINAPLRKRDRIGYAR